MKKVQNVLNTEDLTPLLLGGFSLASIKLGTHWNITPEEMAKFLTEKFSTKEQAVEAVDGVTLIPTFKKDD